MGSLAKAEGPVGIMSHMPCISLHLHILGPDSVRQRGMLISAGERPCQGAADTDIPSANLERSRTQQDSGRLDVLSSPWPSSDEE